MPESFSNLMVNVVYTSPPIYPGDWWFLDNGLPIPPPPPTPGERAFAILEPHLADVPLYWPKFARGGILPKGFGATADAPLRQPDCRWPVVP